MDKKYKAVIMGGATEMSAITNGLRMFKHAK